MMGHIFQGVFQAAATFRPAPTRQLFSSDRHPILNTSRDCHQAWHSLPQQMITRLSGEMYKSPWNTSVLRDYPRAGLVPVVQCLRPRLSIDRIISPGPGNLFVLDIVINGQKPAWQSFAH